jgi:CheY-like chemotaxis protein
MHTIDVLLIDDCDADSKITFAAVRRAAPLASLVRVKDGEQALRLMFHQGLFTNAPHVPRLIVLELNVPRTNGRGVLRRLRDETLAERVPVIVLTSSPDRAALEESYALGARECLVKPNDTAEYLSEVTSAVRRHFTPTPTPSPAGRGLG